MKYFNYFLQRSIISILGDKICLMLHENPLPTDILLNMTSSYTSRFFFIAWKMTKKACSYSIRSSLNFPLSNNHILSYAPLFRASPFAVSFLLQGLLLSRNKLWLIIPKFQHKASTNKKKAVHFRWLNQ